MYVVTGATGQLGRLVVEGLLARVPASEVAVAVRSAGKATDLAARGVDVRVVDYDEPRTLAGAFAAGDRVLLISGSEVGRRVPQHRAVVEAARTAGVALLAYTSILGTATFRLAEEHKATEELILASGLPYAFLRNGWYTENYLADAAGTVARGVVPGSAGDGRVATAPRRDYADAAVAVLLDGSEQNRAYELSGDAAWSLPELAAELAKASGEPVGHRDVTPAEHLDVLVGAGLPQGFAEALVDVDAGIARGELAGTPGDLARLIGRPTVPLAESVRAALGA
ncbi:SDR family oxidoreductase [Kitasatospora aureofaciens]|uniref:NAD(P)-dependent oxidoreductase n=1 Tax=Kitasatospora aureofaciens TaxID=1894 RepID=A0A1E7NA39_KITAU|nr:SDR family oxidoreductase [Kitasatospora aureofaciens]ARF79019.1 NAD(P)-dependent oxidoreductase [Kitasatospora aureofaciens]OEV37552.1 NAD(P)-dependent oxidoreductase [Kitasatospora aureofaciens]GGU83472.1 NAD(P)-dependent oxidoreductase [Kitasatospora aureofaciens]